MSDALLSDLAADVGEQVMVVRQPIFDRGKSVWGYELLSSPPPQGHSEQVAALEDLISFQKEKLSSLGIEFSTDKKLLLNMSGYNHLNSYDFSGYLGDIVFGFSNTAASSEHGSFFVSNMHEQGGSVAIDNDLDESVFDSLMDKCDIVKVSLEGKMPSDIVNIRRKLKNYEGKLLATDVSSWEAFEGTRALGFKIFQGSFFSLPLIEEDAGLQVASVSKLQLIRELNNPGCDMEELASIIASDVSLSYRILKYINSVAFGLKREIKSIQQAVALLGLNELKHWATVVVMTDLDSTPKGEELAYMALQRGRFLSQLAGTIEQCQLAPETMFMLGLFSKLDALLSYPMDKALDGIALDEAIKAGLCGERNEYGNCLRMLEAVETGKWEVANAILKRYGFSVPKAATQYLQASSWAARQLPSMKSQ
ncbi:MULTISPECIES: HDOD domain-containing protein [unclassified Pseudodesulfovibrio]|uniref:EAL and HDOD domain-containing protein n=1 Tax=unclassified Pseudodesulfovibrio TaxID=2661612 RepID=UPI000FEB8D59|nr:MULTISPECIES: HDOD domain-containing protein [unclassified Pseudodesulfovibrio]MCJ2163740.1 HDOD domain-containing protein [Pseudodesulfovibrio sp. S3-i]RWU06007.1 HDOD domain-containing protein [Pseudodesulfovibrio sp. S3]